MTSHSHCNHRFELAAGCLLIVATVGLISALDSCRAKECRESGGRWVSGVAGGSYVSMCFEKAAR